VAAVVVKMDNVDYATTSWVSGKHVPRPGGPLYWDAFIQRTCSLYMSRF
jgi:hypothetical protein